LYLKQEICRPGENITDEPTPSGSDSKAVTLKKQEVSYTSVSTTVATSRDNNLLTACGAGPVTQHTPAEQVKSPPYNFWLAILLSNLLSYVSC